MNDVNVASRATSLGIRSVRAMVIDDKLLETSRADTRRGKQNPCRRFASWVGTRAKNPIAVATELRGESQTRGDRDHERSFKEATT